MTWNDIKSKADILLENGLVEPSSFYDASDKLVLLNNLDIVNDPTQVRFCHRQVGLLVKLYNQCPSVLRTKFRNYMLKHLHYRAFGEMTLAFFLHIGDVDTAFKKIIASLNAPQSYNLKHDALRGLSSALKFEWQLFSSQQILKINQWIDASSRRKNKFGENFQRYTSLYEELTPIFRLIARQTNILLTKQVTQQIELSFNPEVNQDEEKLKEEIGRFGFTPDLSQTLDKVDTMLETATDGFDFQGCMNLLRSFSERLYRQVIDIIDPDNGGKIDEKDSEVVAKFLVSRKVISEEQGQMLKAFRHFLSNRGTHRLKSLPEDARLSRNMMI